MEWKKTSKYSISGTNGYAISAAKVEGRWLYTAWPPRGPYILITEDLEKAKKECEEHNARSDT